MILDGLWKLPVHVVGLVIALFSKKNSVSVV